MTMSEHIPLVVQSAPDAGKPAARPIQQGDVGICFFISSLEDIDVQKETVKVQCDVGIFMLKDDRDGDEDGLEQLKEVQEELWFAQAEAEWDDMIECNIDGRKDGVIGGEIGLELTIKVDMKYDKFPFDVQTVPILMFSNYNLHSAEHFFSKGATAGYARAVAIVPTALISEEWDLASAAVVFEDSDPNETMLEMNQVGVYMTLKRKGTGYMKRFVSVTMVISLSAMLPMVMPQMEFGDILAHQVGLLFAVVGFQLLTSSFLPPTSTLSVLDQYNIGLFLFIFFIMLLVAVEASEDPESQTMDPDRCNDHFFLSIGVWLVGHVAFVSRVLCLIRWKEAAVYVHKKAIKPVMSIRTETMEKETTFHSTPVMLEG